MHGAPGLDIVALHPDWSADSVWNAVRDFEHPDLQLVPGFLVTIAASPTERIVRFSNGIIALERLVTLSDGDRRLVYSVAGGRASHYNAAVQVNQSDDRSSELIWTIDVLPDELVPYVEDNMNRAVAIMQASLNAAG